MSIEPGKFSLEEILKAQRQNKPGPEFWTSFEREFKSRQKRLIQKQIVEESRLKSPFALRLYRVGSGVAAVGFAAFAVVIALRSPETTDSAAQAQGNTTELPSFLVSQPIATKALSTETGLQEFAAVTRSSRPRLVVEALPVARPETAQPGSVAVSNPAVVERRPLRAYASHNIASVPQFGSFDSSSVDDVDSMAHVSSFEQTYLLGKYADPLNDSFGRSRPPTIESGRLANPNMTELDEVLSSRSGSRGQRGLDALTLRF